MSDETPGTPASAPAASEARSRIEASLAGFVPAADSPNSLEAQQAVCLARSLQDHASRLQTSSERRQQWELDRMIHNPGDKATLMELTDQAFRSEVPHRAVDQLIHILDVQGVPRFFSPMDRTLLKGFQSFGGYLPGVAVPMMKHKMHQETANVILPAEREMLTVHLNQRRREGMRMNVNFLGEALLGEEEAQRRLQAYLQALQLPEIEVISVKISTIYSQIMPLARRHTLAELCNRLELLYRAAGRERFTRTDGTIVPKFVYLDMEEYRDMTLTAEAFMQSLDRPGLAEVSAGIVLQAYIPDSYLAQRTITEWARRRVAVGGAPITLRVVKGANMEMERVEASLHGWPQAPFKSKLQTDANYKRMLGFGTRPENLAAVRLGIASHNLFELAYGLVLAAKADGLNQVQFEMLEGMANHQRRALFELTRNMLLYAPACRQDEFIHAIGYLIRRLDENTGPENFLRHAFKLSVGSEDWNQLETGFLRSFAEIESLAETPRRRQDRRQPPVFSAEFDPDWRNFTNEPDTDFALPNHARWARELVDDWLPRCDQRAPEIPLVIDGQQIFDDRPVKTSTDPSRPDTVVARYRQATQPDADAAVTCAKQDADGWRRLPPDERLATLHRAAHELRCSRATLMGAAMVDGGKTLGESDPEVSEAIDFAEFYSRAAHDFQTLPGLSAEGHGVVVVVSPWNFPIAIPCGGVAAALAAGNTVILKPASDTVLVAYELCRCFWRAGVSQRALQFLPCSGGDVGSHLVSHEGVDTVILTGGTSTALAMLGRKPSMRLLAETGGKNATIVTALADRDLAIKNVVHSAFSHSGQKCSATSLLILEEEVYEDADFRRTLCDAVESLHVGPAHELHTRVGPLIRPPSGDLDRGLKELESGESWALLPHVADDNPQLWSPGIKWGVSPGSYTHGTEFFGPVLGVMRARNLNEAIAITNSTGYGLTSGLESLDDREQELWQASIRAGNLYINRSTTGAVVLRQPFGGMGKSAFGPGIKAGGPNYVAQLMQFQETATPEGDAELDNELLADLLARLRQREEDDPLLNREQVDWLAAAIGSYCRWQRLEFGRQHDHFRLLGQDNFRRYLPVKEMRVRVHSADTLLELFARVSAAQAVACRVTVSSPPEADLPQVDLLDELTESWAGAIEFVEETDEQLAEVILGRQTDRIRYAAAERVPRLVREAAAEVQLYVADAPVLRHGRIELLWYVQEQSLCIDYHRYGNLGRRGEEERAEPL